MTNYEDEDDDVNDELEDNEPTSDEEAGAAPSNNRNFLLALGTMGGIFILILIALFVFWLASRGQGGQVSDISATNQVIMTANAATAMAATQVAGLQLTPSQTPTASSTPVLPTATKTQVLAQATATNTPAAGVIDPKGNVGGGGGLATVTPVLQTRTATIQALLTQNAQQTQTQAAKVSLTGTATALPKTGFAEDVGLPGLFGLAAGLVLVIVLVRRMRLSPNG